MRNISQIFKPLYISSMCYRLWARLQKLCKLGASKPLIWQPSKWQGRRIMARSSTARTPTNFMMCGFIRFPPPCPAPAFSSRQASTIIPLWIARPMSMHRRSMFSMSAARPYIVILRIIAVGFDLIRSRFSSQSNQYLMMIRHVFLPDCATVRETLWFDQ